MRISDKERLGFLIEYPLVGFVIFGRAGHGFVGEIVKNCKSVREAIDAVMKAAIKSERAAKRGK